MRLLQMYPKDITVICEFSIVDLMKLRKAMDMVEVQFNQMNQEEVEAKDFLTINFMEWLDTCIKEATNA